MEIKIKDGGGTSQMASVDDHGRLSVKANHISHQSHHSTFHKNFFFNSFSTTLSGATEEPCLFIKNGGGSDGEFYELIISSNAEYKFRIVVNPEYTSGGTAVTSVNSNLGSGKISSLTMYQGGNVLALNPALEKTILEIFKGARESYEFNYEGSLIISPGSSYAIYVTGVASQEVKININNSFHSEGTKL